MSRKTLTTGEGHTIVVTEGKTAQELNADLDEMMAKKMEKAIKKMGKTTVDEFLGSDRDYDDLFKGGEEQALEKIKRADANSGSFKGRKR